MIINRLIHVLNETDVTSPSHAIAKNLLVCIKKEKAFNITKLARMSGTSKAMVSKFSKQLGYEQFKDLKDDCNMYKMKQITAKPVDLFLEDFKLELDTIDFSLLKKIARSIKNAHCVYIYGCGYNYVLAIQLQNLLLDLDLPIVIMDDLLSRQYHIKEQALLLIIDLQKDTDLSWVNKKLDAFSQVIQFNAQNRTNLMGNVYMELLSIIVHNL